MISLTRRSLLAGLCACAACRSQPVPGASLDVKVPPLKTVTHIPVGCCVTTEDIINPSFAPLLLKNFSQITPSYEMKMNIALRPDGTLNCSAADKIVAFAVQNKLRVHGTSLVWYKHEPEAFMRLDGQRAAFADLYHFWIESMVKRYSGKVAGWDVINEPITHEGDKLRDSLWTRNLGPEDHMVLAFENAAAADPNAVHFINEYDLERKPAKRLVFMRLVESLLKKGAKIGGIGSQSHLEVDLPKGASKNAIADIASFGLPIHISELDVSLGRWRANAKPLAEKLADQAATTAEIADAFVALPDRQRYAITLWGLRDEDSWLQMPPFDPARGDLPLGFDDKGQPKPMLASLVNALQRAPL